MVPMVTIPQGNVGYVFARDGVPLAESQILASNSTANNFADVEQFLANGGQRGSQRQLLREGTHAINLAQFVVLASDRAYYLPLDPNDARVYESLLQTLRERDAFGPVIIRGADDSIGVVVVQEGAALPADDIIAPIVGDDPAQRETYHDGFQDPEKFLRGGGNRGRQLQVLTEGTYYINRLFATVEIRPKIVIPVGHVGVVISYTGKPSRDVSGKEFLHGELVERDYKGVWESPLLPGKYAFNTFAGKVVSVPTTNIILKWNRTEVGTHRLDENLAEVSLITKDCFEPNLALSVVMHIDYKKAPRVIQRFGDIKMLVEQTLDPLVSAYFKNIGQTHTLIELLQYRAEIQELASKDMKSRFSHYNLELEEVLIGTPKSSAGDKQIDIILDQLRARQVAQEQIETFQRQQDAAVKERSLREAESRAKQQTAITESELNIEKQRNAGMAEVERAVQSASQITAIAEAEGAKTRLLAAAEAEKRVRVGVAESIAIEEQVKAYGGPRYQLTQDIMTRFSSAIGDSGVDVVPKVVFGGGGGGQVFDTILHQLNASIADDASAQHGAARNAFVEDLRRQLKSQAAAMSRLDVPASMAGRGVTVLPDSPAEPADAAETFAVMPASSDDGRRAKKVKRNAVAPAPEDVPSPIPAPLQNRPPSVTAMSPGAPARPPSAGTGRTSPSR